MRSYLVIVSPSYGGAEKRFFDVFTSLHRQGADIALIAPSSLVDQLKADHPDRPDVLAALMPVEMAGWSRLDFIRKFRRMLRTLPRGSSFHYPINCLWPLHLGRGDRVSMSVVDCTRVPALSGGTLTSAWTWLTFFFVGRIDVLSPTILAAMRNYRAAHRMSLTPGGTFLVPPPPHHASGKLPTAVLLGRLVPGKGVDDLLDVLPEVWSRLRGRAPQGFKFQVAGYGPLEGHVVERVGQLVRSGVPLEFVGYAAADALLSKAGVLLSLQEVTNYPSRVVAEGLMAGCGVIVRDTGDSRQFGSELPGLVYCKARLDATELADLLTMLLDKVMFEPTFSHAVRDAACSRFSSQLYIDYFRDVMSAEPASSRPHDAPTAVSQTFPSDPLTRN